jgi:TatA/E family protein of Tat protein translocase
MPFLKGADMLIVLAIVMVLFGSTLIPKLARSWGKAIHEVKNMTQDDAKPEADLTK